VLDKEFENASKNTKTSMNKKNHPEIWEERKIIKAMMRMN
jgi:hypothetical protein